MKNNKDSLFARGVEVAQRHEDFDAFLADAKWTGNNNLYRVAWRLTPRKTRRSFRKKYGKDRAQQKAWACYMKTWWAEAQ